METKPRTGWTAREAFACACCWAYFGKPEDRDDTPEAYWLRITEHARNSYRAEANERMLLAVARGQAVAVPPVNSFQEGQMNALTAALRMKSEHRVRQIVDAVLRTFKVTA